MSFDSRNNARKYIPQDGDTLRTIAERETADGNEITWQEIAKFNWGTDDENEVNEYLRDELGSYRRDDANNFVISSDADARGELLIPMRFEKTGLALNTTHTLRVRKKTSPPQFLECASIPGVTFEFDKSFVRPSVVDHIKKLEEAVERHPDAKAMIFGHTDTSGPDSYNKALSERRARSVFAFITDDPDEWEKLYKEENWGMRVIQLIMTDFGDPYDPGRTDGFQDARTTQAIRQYQGDRGMTEDGVAGPDTRWEMFYEYMTSKHDVHMTPEQFMNPKHMGCGEFNPIDPVKGRHEPNRRVTFYMFNQERPPNLPCEHGNLSPCKDQMRQTEPRHWHTFQCSFYDSIAKDCPWENPLKLVANAEIIEIKGLYKPGVDDRPEKLPGTTKNSGYEPGYISVGDQGRIFTNRTPDGTWTENTQYIELTAKVSPDSFPIPSGSRIAWTFEDPDDPTNENPLMHEDVGQLLDPNDYAGSTKTGANDNDNDPRGKADETPRFEQIDAKYALAGGNETMVDVSDRISKVRFHVSDIAGDNYRVTAEFRHPSISSSAPFTTGIMTVWDRVEVEYVRMASASELPVDKIAEHYDNACVQVDVSIKRVVTGVSDKPYMGTDDDAAYYACEDYCTQTYGEFTMEDQKGWFFIAAGNRYMPPNNARLLYEGDARAFGDRVRLPPGINLDREDEEDDPKYVRIFNAARSAGLPTPKPNDYDIHTKFEVTIESSGDLVIIKHDFHEVDDPNKPFLLADLSDYGFALGETIPVQVFTDGDQVSITGGISPGGVDIGGKLYFAGKLLVFTGALPEDRYTQVLCHELCHAFDNAHKCGNWDWIKQTDRTSCCMNYWYFFVLDDASPRKPIQWTQNRAAVHLCGPHLRNIRDYQLEKNPGLGWGTP